MAFVPMKSYKMTTSGAGAVTALALDFPAASVEADGYRRQALVYVTSADDAVIKLGASDVSASATYTSSALPDGNALLAKSSVTLIDLKAGQTHASIIRPASTDVTVHFVLGYDK